MSPLLSLIVYGQVYFLGSGTNIRPTVTGSDNSIAIPAIDQTLDETQPFQGNQNSVLVPEINRRRREMGLSENNVKRSDYNYTPGIGGHKFHTKAATWNEARKVCESEGAHLAIVNSAREAEVIGNLFTKSGPHFGSKDSNYAHIGFHDLYEEGEFVTIDGKSLATVGFYEWKDGEPNNHGNNENCGSVYKMGQLNDIDCAKSVAFVCELPDISRIVVIGAIFLALAATVKQLQVDATTNGVLLVAIPLQTANDTAPCLVRGQSSSKKRDDYTYVHGLGGYKLHTRATTWVEARLICQEEGGHLAVINSVAEADAVSQVFKNAERITGSGYLNDAFIGFHDLYREGEYVTIHGESLEKAGYDLWHTNQPNNLNNNQNCGGIHDNGRLNDLPCKGQLFGFICEVPAARDTVHSIAA
ncbi:macrophage mannose receptor 1-like [Neodiprion fabricii]|uniref:macrophage mannose receptor 1-like n=1 Tax=Neodiprion fabricii TaxID=2872261 RepID=UPI001ED95620|nr:macrophage mannose receptor 1-like [Neodiprion fabricii]